MNANVNIALNSPTIVQINSLERIENTFFISPTYCFSVIVFVYFNLIRSLISGI